MKTVIGVDGKIVEVFPNTGQEQLNLFLGPTQTSSEGTHGDA